MTSVKNLSSMGSMAIHTLREGSITERVILGTALLATGVFIAYKIYSVAARIFAKEQPSFAPSKHALTQETKEAIARRIREQHPIPADVPVQNAVQSSPSLPVQIISHPLLTSLTINSELVTKEKEAQLAEALRAYQKLRTETLGGEEGFTVLTEYYLQSNGAGLPAIVPWKEKKLNFRETADTSRAFADLEQKLRQVGLSLKSVKRSETSIAHAQFGSGPSKEIYDLRELYEMVNLHAPQILCIPEIRLKKQQLEEGKRKLHEIRLNIVDKTLSTLSDVLLNDLALSFSKKHTEIYTIFGSSHETLRFLVDNICWHALDRVLELVENNLIPSKEKQQTIRKADLELHLANVLKDDAKRTLAQSYLVQLLINPSDSAMRSFVVLLQEEVSSPERDALIKKVQIPQLTVEAEAVAQEQGRSNAVQSFYHVAELVSAALEKGKMVFLTEKGGHVPARLTLERMPPEVSSEKPRNEGKKTYADQINEVTLGIVGAGESAVQAVVGQRWDEALLTLEHELKQVPNLSSEVCDSIVSLGWKGFKDRQALFSITGPQRWLITKKMIVSKLAQGSLQQSGKKLLQEVGSGTASFVTTLYGRFVSALLAFDKRTKEARQNEFRPADRIATTLIDSVSKCHEALTRVKKGAFSEAGKRENAIVKELNESLHSHASNKSSADTVFLGKLIYQLLSILQPEGLKEDIGKAVTAVLTNPGEEELSIISKFLAMYNQKVLPAIAPWLKPLGDFLLQALENIIERQSTSNAASQLSDMLDSVNINASLVELLRTDRKTEEKADKTDAEVDKNTEEKKDEFKIEMNVTDRKEPGKWYIDEEENVGKLLLDRSSHDFEIKTLEAQLEALKKAGSADGIRKITDAVILKKQDLAALDLKLAPELLRRYIIENVDAEYVGYALQFGEDLFELIQYPRIVRHVVFNVLEKTVESLATSLNDVGSEEAQRGLLAQPIRPTEDQSVFKFLFSDQFKTYFGNKIGALFWSISPKTNSWSGMFAQAAARIAIPGHLLFYGIQRKLESLIRKKYSNEKEISWSKDQATNWSAAKLVVTMSEKIQAFAKKPGPEGMAALIATRLKRVIGVKEKQEPELL